MAWGIWAIITVVLLIAETLTVDFLFMMFAAGTLAATLTSVLAPDALVVQIVVFGVISSRNCVRPPLGSQTCQRFLTRRI
ncbi:NfeD family protein [Trueperella pyogenes]|uniref:NfeD family protein n=1 Tax=Trueperella pyogenes TaxID=1661 RepID=UPI00325303E6